MSMRVLCLLLFLLSALFISCAQQRRQYPHSRETQFSKKNLEEVPFIRKRVALFPLFNEAPYGGEDLALVATEELREELSRTQEFVVDSRASTEFQIPSKQIYSGGGGKLSQLARKAKLSGINFILYGRIIDVELREKTDDIGVFRKSMTHYMVKIELRIFDVTSNREIFNKTFVNRSSKEAFRPYKSSKEYRLSYRQKLLRSVVRAAIRKSISRIVESSRKIVWVGRVAKIIGSKIYLNTGRNSGIQVGDVMKVITEGTEIYDPETGAFIGVSQGEVKGTLEVIDYFGPDGSIAILHSGGSIVAGDFVQLY